MPETQRFPRTARLTRRSEFQTVYRNGEKRSGRAFICYRLRHNDFGQKLGLAVSRKVGGAVVRNRIKRYLREIYRRRRSQLPDDEHIVIVARPASADLSFAECEAVIDKLLEDRQRYDS